METTQPYLPLLNEIDFKRSVNRISAGNTEEYDRVKRTHALTADQNRVLSELHKLAIHYAIEE